MKWLSVLVLILTITTATSSQSKGESTIYGTNVVLVGSVADKVGTEIPGVKITFKGVAGKKYKATTDNKGEFRVGLAVGIYTVEFRTYGFERLVLKKYIVNSTEDGKVQRLYIRMEVKPSVWTD